MINRKKQYEKHKNIKIDILIVVMLLVFALISILLKSNILLIVEAMLIGIIFTWYVYTNDKRLLIFTILGILLTPTFSIINGTLSNIPYFILFLLCLKIVEKIILKQKIEFNKIIVLLTITLFIINIFSLIYNQYNSNIILLLFYSLKKFSFLILYLFFISANITKKDIKNSLNIFIIFGLIQFAIVSLQFAGGIRQDKLAGMFGQSDTGVMIEFLTIILILITIFKNEIIKIPYLDLIVMILSLIYSAMGEIKVGFIIIPFTYLILLLLKGEKAKVIVSTIVIFFSFSIIYTSFIKLYPNQDFLSSLTSSKDYLENAYGSEQANRIGFLPLLESTVINTTEKQLFGNGLATINPSKVDILQGDLVRKYGYMNIHFFSLPYSITESGLVGTFIWLMIYIYILATNIKEYLLYKSKRSIVNIVLIINIFIFIVYNNSIFTSFSIILFLWFIISYFDHEGLNLLDTKN